MAIIDYHAVMIGEDGMEFGVTFGASSWDDAFDHLKVNYPESRIDDLKSCAEWARAEQARYDRISSMYEDDTIDLW